MRCDPPPGGSLWSILGNHGIGAHKRSGCMLRFAQAKSKTVTQLHVLLGKKKLVSQHFYQLRRFSFARSYARFQWGAIEDSQPADYRFRGEGHFVARAHQHLFLEITQPAGACSLREHGPA